MNELVSYEQTDTQISVYSDVNLYDRYIKMAETKIYTPAGFKALQDELDYLVTVKVEENKKDISTARAFGDLSENAEYDAARNEQAVIETRIKELETILENATIIDAEGKEKVFEMAKVENKLETVKYQRGIDFLSV